MHTSKAGREGMDYHLLCLYGSQNTVTLLLSSNICEHIFKIYQIYFLSELFFFQKEKKYYYAQEQKIELYSNDGVAL